MLQTTPDDRAPIGPPSPEPAPGSSASIEPATLASAHLAAQSLSRSGPFLRWALLGLGILWGASHVIGVFAVEPASSAMRGRAVLDAAAMALAFGLAGWVSDLICRMAAAGIVARAGRDERSAEILQHLAGRAIAAVERLADAMEHPPLPIAPAEASDQERPLALAAIDEAVRASRRDDAEALLDRFEARFPGDPAAPALRERIDAARREEVQERIAQIDAARRVNDPDRVLELYRALGSSLDFERRGELERDLAKWFLDLIHRRLRVGRIQVDVVHLTAQAADAFGATVEGASLRASLPVLRRSVGLCPRCAQPYVGPDAACPKCQSGTAGASAPAPPVLPPGPDATP
jgi:hypothetical protein